MTRRPNRSAVVRLVHLLPGVRLDQLVEADHADQVRRAVHPQVGLAVGGHGQQRERPALAHLEQPREKGALLHVGLGRRLHQLGQPRKQLRRVPRRLVGRARQVQRHVLQRRVAHPPGLARVLEIRLLELEGEPAALGDLGGLAAVEDEVGVPLLGRDGADQIQELLVPGGPEELLGDVHQRLGEEERPPGAVAAEVDLEERLDEALRLGQVVRVGLAGVRAAGADRRHRLEVLRRLPVEVDVREDRLPAARDGLLRVLVDQDLGQLAHLAVGEADEKRREEDVHRVPADGARRSGSAAPPRTSPCARAAPRGGAPAWRSRARAGSSGRIS